MSKRFEGGKWVKDTLFTNVKVEPLYNVLISRIERMIVETVIGLKNIA